MVLRTYFDKNNTIIKNDYSNTAKNPVTELFYGGADGENTYSRFLFHFDASRLINFYTGGTFTDLTRLKHTLKLTNTASFDTGLLNGTYQNKARSTSFDLVVFTINQDWDEGVGYDYQNRSNLLMGNVGVSTYPSNWIYPQTGIYWDYGPGVYSANPTTMIAQQHFDNGNEDFEVDITNYVNGLITGNTNYGLGIAYARPYELTSTRDVQYVGFFTKYTQTFYEPFVETKYDDLILDDRYNFFLDKRNKLYLYVNLQGNPANLDVLPTVTVYDTNNNVFSAYSSTAVTHVTKGVYSIDLIIPESINFQEGSLINDVWSNIVINGVSRPDITLDIQLRSSLQYYNIGDNDSLPKQVAVSISGVKNQEKIKRGDVRKVLVSTRIPYTVEQTQTLTNMKYRLYIMEGRNQITVTDFTPINIATPHNYFLLDTASLIPGTYYLDIQVESNLDITTLSNVINFDVTSQSTERISQ